MEFPTLYPIIDAALCDERGIDPAALAEACLAGGARLLQLRARKDESSAAILHLAERLVAAAHRVGARVIVNDRADIACLADADGVHVGQSDLEVAAVRAIVGPDRIVGVSTHDRAQIDDALAGDATYVAVGPVFLTATKDSGYTPRGLDLVRYAAHRGMPVVAIGGIYRRWFNLIDNPRLDRDYTVFGRVSVGADVLDRILECDAIERVTIFAR